MTTTSDLQIIERLIYEMRLIFNDYMPGVNTFAQDEFQSILSELRRYPSLWKDREFKHEISKIENDINIVFGKKRSVGGIYIMACQNTISSILDIALNIYEIEELSRSD